MHNVDAAFARAHEQQHRAQQLAPPVVTVPDRSRTRPDQRQPHEADKPTAAHAMQCMQCLLLGPLAASHCVSAIHRPPLTHHLLQPTRALPACNLWRQQQQQPTGAKPCIPPYKDLCGLPRAYATGKLSLPVALRKLSELSKCWRLPLFGQSCKKYTCSWGS